MDAKRCTQEQTYPLINRQAFTNRGILITQEGVVQYHGSVQKAVDHRPKLNTPLL